MPRALAAAGCLDQVVTDACDTVAPWRYLATLPSRLRPAPLRDLLGRHIPGVEANRTRGSLRTVVATQWHRLRARSSDPRVDLWVRQNGTFARAVNAVDWRAAEVIYAFNGAALETFELARRRGLRCVLDQTAAPWSFNTERLRHEQARWPGWERQPDDIDPAGRMAERERAEWELADRIICGSSFVADAVAAAGGPRESAVSSPYPLPPAPPQAVTHKTRAGRRLRVLFVGTLQLRKGIQYLWDAAAVSRPTRHEFRAVGRSRLEPEAEARVRGRMDWTGRVERSAVWPHYAWADVFVLPTISEGSANVCWEALASGVPVITTPAAGADAATVRLAQPDTASIADAIQAVARPRAGPGPGARAHARGLRRRPREGYRMSRAHGASIAVLWQRFGPYHVARLRGAAQALAAEGGTVTGIEIAARDQYAWAQAQRPGIVCHTLFPDQAYSQLSRHRIRAAVAGALDRLSPDAVCINGWAVPEALAALAWCRRHGRRAILMSETFEPSRNSLKTLVKRARLRDLDAAMVGGRLHAAYLAELGYPRDRISLGIRRRRQRSLRHAPPRRRSRRFDGRTSLPTRGSCDARESTRCCMPMRATGVPAQHDGLEPWPLVISG